MIRIPQDKFRFRDPPLHRAASGPRVLVGTLEWGGVPFSTPALSTTGSIQGRRGPPPGDNPPLDRARLRRHLLRHRETQKREEGGYERNTNKRRDPEGDRDGVPDGNRCRDIKEARRQKGKHTHRQMLESQRGTARDRRTETQRQRQKE